MKESKEFELQGDISSGFHWRAKGAGEQELEEMMGGDSPESATAGTKRLYRIQSGEKRRPPSGTAITFDLGYELLLASEGEARRQLLAPLAMLPLAYVEKFVDPYVARELHRQELRDKELRDVLNALFGKAADWRVALCIEAGPNNYARGELACDAAIEDGIREADRFLAAFKMVTLIKKRGPVKTAKAWALLFALGCRVYGKPMPTKGEVLRFLESKGIAFVKEHAARDIFTGPILDALLRGRAGRPRKTRRARK
jgi:hypothetical protein